MTQLLNANYLFIDSLFSVQGAVIVGLVVLFFGSKKLPEIARNFGKSVGELKSTVGGVGGDIKDGFKQAKDESGKVSSKVKSDLNDIKTGLKK